VQVIEADGGGAGQVPDACRRRMIQETSNMTKTLVSKTCTPCRGGIPPLTRKLAEVFRAQTPDWQLRDDRIERRFSFSNFREALSFVQEIGELAEAEGHHPDISFGWAMPRLSDAGGAGGLGSSRNYS
jgi:4a-hydroxytetrahydrobiopterin dehydratase